MKHKNEYTLFSLISILLLFVLACDTFSEENKKSGLRKSYSETGSVAVNDVILGNKDSIIQYIVTYPNSSLSKLDSFELFKHFVDQKCYEELNCDRLTSYYDTIIAIGYLDTLLSINNRTVTSTWPSLHNESFRNHNYLIDIYNKLLTDKPTKNTAFEYGFLNKLMLSIKKVIQCKTGKEITNDRYIDDYYYLPNDSILHQIVSNIHILSESESIIPLPLDFVIDPGDSSYFDNEYLLTRTIEIPKDYNITVEINEVNETLCQFLITNEYKNSSEWTSFYDTRKGTFISTDEVINKYMNTDFVSLRYDSSFNQMIEEEATRLLELTMDMDSSHIEEYDVYQIALSQLSDCVPAIEDTEVYVSDSITTFTIQCGLSNSLYDFHVRIPMNNEDVFKK